RRHTTSKRDWSSDVCSSDLSFQIPFIMKRLKRMIPELVLSIGLIFMVSCSDSSTNPTQQGNTPEFPPAKSMAMDFSIFASGQSEIGRASCREIVKIRVVDGY